MYSIYYYYNVLYIQHSNSVFFHVVRCVISVVGRAILRGTLKILMLSCCYSTVHIFIQNNTLFFVLPSWDFITVPGILVIGGLGGAVCFHPI